MRFFSLLLAVSFLLVGASAFAADGDLIVNGSLSVGSGGIKFPDGSTQTTAGGFSNFQYITTSGNWTVPAGITKIKVEVWGGGGGGATMSTYGGAGGRGGTTSIGSLISATGGYGAPLCAGGGYPCAGGDAGSSTAPFNITGGAGGFSNGQDGLSGVVGTGGSAPKGGPGGTQVNRAGRVPGGGGAGGGGNGGSGYASGAGGGGGYGMGIFTVTPGQVFAVTVGAGGNAGGSTAGAGANGAVLVWW